MLFSLNYIRFFAASLVLLSHVSWKGEQYANNPMDWFRLYGGTPGVDLFFIISGFILPYILHDKNNLSPIKFMLERISKIIPLYWLLTIVALLIFLIMPDRVNSSGGNTSIVASFFLLPTDDKYLLQVGWTLTYFMIFYFIYSIGLFFNKNYRIIVPNIIIMMIVLVGLLYESKNVYLNAVTSSLLIEFVYGGLVFYIYKNHKMLNSYTSLIVLFLSITIFFYFKIHVPSDFRAFNQGFPALLFFISILSLEKYVKKLHTGKFALIIDKLGYSSYSTYLVHPFILTALSMVMVKLGINAYGFIYSVSLYIGALIFGYITFIYIEVPLHRYSKKLLAKFS